MLPDNVDDPMAIVRAQFVWTSTFHTRLALLIFVFADTAGLAAWEFLA